MQGQRRANGRCEWKQQEAAEQLQVSSAPVAGETGTGQLSCRFYGFYLLASARVICLPLWGWMATKELKPSSCACREQDL